MKIKVITLQQPWASAIVMGYKSIETRSRNCKHIGPMAIHSSQKPASKKKIFEMQELCKQMPFKMFAPDYHALPFGKIIGQVDITGTARTQWIIQHADGILKPRIKNWSWEYLLGDYSFDRFGYFMENIIMYNNPIPAKGNQIIGWEFDLPPIESLMKTTNNSL